VGGNLKPCIRCVCFYVCLGCVLRYCPLFAREFTVRVCVQEAERVSRRFEAERFKLQAELRALTDRAAAAASLAKQAAADPGVSYVHCVL